MTIREQIIQAIVALLAGCTLNGSAVKVTRYRVDSVQPEEIPLFNVAIDAESATELTQNSCMRTVTLSVWAAVAAADSTDTDSIDAVADPMTAYAEQKIMADPTLGGLTLACNFRSAAWQNVAADLDYCGVRMVFEVMYQTALGDPTQA
jgi:hypothetical protein